jgi:ABC-type glycerol-3-phosphate transport system substrate-binding protein
MKNTVKIFLAVLLITAAGSLFTGPKKDGGTGRVTPITFLLLGNKPTNGRAEAAVAEINKIVGPRIGVELRTEYVEWADWQSQYQLRMASGDPNLDLVVSATDWLYAWEIVRDGGFYPLTPELLQKNAPQTWAEIPRSHWDLCTENGKIWFIPEDQYSQYTNHGMYWRKDWAREGGLTNIAAFEDLEKYWDAVKKNHPEAYPWDVSGAEYRDYGLIGGYIQGKRPIQTIIGVPNIFQYILTIPIPWYPTTWTAAIW